MLDGFASYMRLGSILVQANVCVTDNGVIKIGDFGESELPGEPDIELSYAEPVAFATRWVVWVFNMWGTKFTLPTIFRLLSYSGR